MVGISTDRVTRQRKFVESSALPYTLLSDTGGEVCRAYGVRGLLGFAGRVSFLIDGDTVIRKVYPKVSPATHAAEVLEDLLLLTKSDVGTAGEC